MLLGKFRGGTYLAYPLAAVLLSARGKRAENSLRFWAGGSMIKTELVLRVSAKNPHLFPRDAERIVNAILETIAAAMVARNRVELRGFGTFSVRRRSARKGRNPGGRAAVARLSKSWPGIWGKAEAARQDWHPRRRPLLVSPICCPASPHRCNSQPFARGVSSWQLTNEAIE